MNFLKNLYSLIMRIGRLLKCEKVSDSPKLFQLNRHCFYEIFEYLCVEDLHSFGQTCRQMNRVAGEYFKENHSWDRKHCEKDGIYTYILNKDWVNQGIQTPGFNKFIPFITHSCDSRGPLKYIKSHINEFESINHIYLQHITSLNKKKVKYFENLLPQLEIIHIKECLVDGDFYDLILKYCSNLKGIYFEYSDVSSCINSKFNWLLQEYPMLEHLYLAPPQSGQVGEIHEFFVRNPNVQTFSTDTRFLWDNGSIFLNSNIKLDILELKQGKFKDLEQCSSDRKRMWKTILEFLNQLHEQGFYKRLHIFGMLQGLSTKLALIKGLELLCISHFVKEYNLGQLTNLRELMVRAGSDYVEDMENLANNLTKLDRLCIYSENIDVVMPFIRRSLKLNKLKFCLCDSVVPLNLAMLNEERAKLFGARKITIYVCDNVFLATKWRTRNGDTNLSFIELRRKSSIKWSPDYFTDYFD